MARPQVALPSTLATLNSWPAQSASPDALYDQPHHHTKPPVSFLGEDKAMMLERDPSSAGKGVLIGMLSAFGSALFIAILLGLFYFFKNTSRGRILLDRIGRPGEYDDEQAFAKEESDALEHMDDLQRMEYLRAKAFVQGNPPESADTDISLSQFLAIQEKGVSAWEFEPELEVANCFVEGRTEIEFYDTECSVQSNLPIPKQNEVYYWEAKIYDKPESTSIGIGVTTKPYPLFRMPGLHKTSVAYSSAGHRRFNQPFSPTPSYGPAYVRGDVVGCGYRPRTGTIFFTRNGKKLEDVTSTLKTQNLFPTIGANGPCSVHVNFGQMGFVFIEANVKKWGLAPVTGSLAPPPPYGSEAGSILLEGGQHGVPEGQGFLHVPSGGFGSWSGNRSPGRSRSATLRLGRSHPTSPGPQRSPTDISLNQLSFSETDRQGSPNDAGEGASMTGSSYTAYASSVVPTEIPTNAPGTDSPPPGYEGPSATDKPGNGNQDHDSASDGASTPRASTARASEDNEADGAIDSESRRLLPPRTSSRRHGRSTPPSPPIPSYDAAVSGTGDR